MYSQTLTCQSHYHQNCTQLICQTHPCILNFIFDECTLSIAVFCICFIKIDWKYFTKPSFICRILFVLMYKITSPVAVWRCRIPKLIWELQCGLWGTCLQIFDLLHFSEWPQGVVLHAQRLARCSWGVDGKASSCKPGFTTWMQKL